MPSRSRCCRSHHSSSGVIDRVDEAQTDLAHSVEMAREGDACLLCFERDHTDCHRDIVADLIRARTGQAVRHLVADAPR